jgi:hypothetical protein
MRRSFAAVMLIATLAGAAACAHPHEVPRKGESPQTGTTSANTPTTPDETATVCSEAQSVSTTAVDDLTSQLAAAQADLAANDQAAALAAALQARTIGTNWKSQLQGFADRNVKPSVRDALTSGVNTIDSILSTSPQDLNANTAQQQVNDFLDKLRSACS